MDRPVADIDCRSVGPGGTTVRFYPCPTGVKAVWTNENCPYDYSGSTNHPETREASDGHNVSFLSWEELDAMMRHRPARPTPPGLNPQTKKGGKRR